MLKLLPVSLYNVSAVETWLSDQARRGRHAVGFFGGSVRFQKGEPCERQFRLEPQFLRPNALDRETLELYASAGWEPVAPTAQNRFYLWRSTRPDPREIHTDPETEELAYGWAAQIQEEHLRMAGASAFVVFALSLLIICTSQTLLLSFITPGTGLGWCFLMIILALPESLADFLAIRRLRKRLLSGVPVAHTAAPYRLRRWGRRAVNVVIAVLFVSELYMVSDKRTFCEQDSFPVPPAAALGVEAPLKSPLVFSWGKGLVVAAELSASQMTRDDPGKEASVWQADIYRLRLPFLAGQVLRDVAYSQITYKLDRAPVPLENTPFDEARYLQTGDGTQYLVARSGGRVLYYKANVPEDLRDHLGEFAAALAAA